MRIWMQEKCVLDRAMLEARQADHTQSLTDAELSGIAFRNSADSSRVLLLLDRC